MKTVVLVNWKINQQKITELYCINKDNPMMHCEGKCYLSLQLRKIENDYRDSKTPPDLKHLKGLETAICPSEFQLTQHFRPDLNGESASRGGSYKTPHSSPFPQRIFHPPAKV